MTVKPFGGLVILAMLTACRHGADHVPANPDADVLAKASQGCRTDADCWDVGPVCPAHCHYAISTEREHSEVFEVVDAARLRQASGECKMACGKTFYGLECRAGMCAERKSRPTESLCFRIGRGPADCIAVVRQHSLQDRCHEFCDGLLSDPTRIQFRIEPPPEVKEGDGYRIDYLTCADCARAALDSKNK